MARLIIYIHGKGGNAHEADIIESTLHYLKMKGYVRVRLGVDRGNPQSYSFWLKNGFVKICESNYIIMERLL